MSNSTATPGRNRTEMIARIFAFALLAVGFVLLPNVARADATAPYDISGTLQSGGTFSGVIEFDQSGSTLQLINTSFTVDGNSFSCSGASSNTCTVYDPFGVSYVTIQGQGPLMVFNWLDSSFNISNPPSSFNFLGGYCVGCSPSGVDFLAAGTANAVAAPEPASWMLLGLGVLGLSLISRRRPNSFHNLD
jgi:hypothetical protein